MKTATHVRPILAFILSALGYCALASVGSNYESAADALLKHANKEALSAEETDLIVSYFNERSQQEGEPFDEGEDFIWEGLLLINELKGKVASNALSQWLFYNAESNQIIDGYKYHKKMNYYTVFPVSCLFWEKDADALASVLDRLFISDETLAPAYESQRVYIAKRAIGGSCIPIEDRIRIVEEYSSSSSPTRADKLRDTVLKELLFWKDYLADSAENNAPDVLQETAANEDSKFPANAPESTESGDQRTEDANNLSFGTKGLGVAFLLLTVIILIQQKNRSAN